MNTALSTARRRGLPAVLFTAVATVGGCTAADVERDECAQHLRAVHWTLDSFLKSSTADTQERFQLPGASCASAITNDAEFTVCEFGNQEDFETYLEYEEESGRDVARYTLTVAVSAPPGNGAVQHLGETLKQANDSNC